MRLCIALAIATSGPAFGDVYHDLGKPEQCGNYGEASYDRESWFPGGEGGLIGLTDPQPVRGLNAMLFEGTVTEEGFSDPAGRILALRGPLASSDGASTDEVVIIMTDSGIRVLQPCP